MAYTSLKGCESYWTCLAFAVRLSTSSIRHALLMAVVDDESVDHNVMPVVGRDRRQVSRKVGKQVHVSLARY